MARNSIKSKAPNVPRSLLAECRRLHVMAGSVLALALRPFKSLHASFAVQCSQTSSSRWIGRNQHLGELPGWLMCSVHLALV
jgi:hypothetical protein